MSTHIKRSITMIVMFFLITVFASASPFSNGFLQRAEVADDVVLGGNFGLGIWPGAARYMSVGAAGEYAFSGEDTDDSSFTLNNLAVGGSVSYDRVTVTYGSHLTGSSWSWNNFKFGPYAKYQFFDLEDTREALGDSMGLHFSALAGFKLNLDSVSSSDLGYYSDYGGSTILVDALVLADYPLSNVVDDGFFNNVTLTSGLGVVNNRFAWIGQAWYDKDNMSFSLGYRPLIGLEASVMVRF